MSRRKVPGVLITAVQTGWSEPSLTSRPSQRRKAKGAAIWPNTSRRTRAAPAGLGLGSAIIRIPPRSFYRGLADLVNPSQGQRSVSLWPRYWVKLRARRGTREPALPSVLSVG